MKELESRLKNSAYVSDLEKQGIKVDSLKKDITEKLKDKTVRK